MKRLFDIFISSIGIVAFLPLMLLIHMAIKLEDGGPSIYRQKRIGRYGKPFNILKFRSMKQDYEESIPELDSPKSENTLRLSKTGKFLRAHHLDEILQLFNVWVGDMSFVGYRPERKFFIDKIMEKDDRYERLYAMRPGITSCATIYNGYTDTMEKMLRRLEMDLEYLEHHSLLLDLKIIFLTASKVISGKKI